MEKENSTIYATLSKIQAEIRVEKGRLNKFGGFNYRSLDDIFEAFKPFAKKYNVSLIINDDIVDISGNLFLKTTAILVNEKGEKVEVAAFAKHSMAKKGFDEAQLTGMASSYARKYALNALFVLDDTPDIDAENNTQPKAAAAWEEDDYPDRSKRISFEQKEILMGLIAETNTDVRNILKYYKCKALDDVNFESCHKMLLRKKEGINGKAN